MNAFLPLLIQAMKSDVATTVKRTKRQVILYSVLCLFALTTYLLAIVAAITYAAIHLGAFEAILIATAISAATSLLVVAIIACVAVYFLIWRTKLGYEIRAFGHSESGAKYAGISPVKITVIAMLISGGLAGMMATNNVMGESERLIMNATEGAGFIGIAVALMGRSHPFGVFLAAILFGFLARIAQNLRFGRRSRAN